MDSLVLQNNGKGRKAFLEDVRLFSNIPETTHESHCFLLSNSLSPPPLSSSLSLHSKMRKGYPVQISLSHSSALLEPTVKKSLLNLCSYYCLPSVHRGCVPKHLKGLTLLIIWNLKFISPQESSLLHPQ